VHVIFAERLPDSQPPRWAEEGLALLNDSEDKKQRHRSDFCRAANMNSSLSLKELFSAADYPDSQRRAAFYGESLSLVEFLTEQSGPHVFVEFVACATDCGYDNALKVVYDIDGIEDLDRRWNDHLEHAVLHTAKPPDASERASIPNRGSAFPPTRAAPYGIVQVSEYSRFRPHSAARRVPERPSRK
jgi:hypothetical protein